MKKILILIMLLALTGCDTDSMDGSLFGRSNDDGEVEYLQDDTTDPVEEEDPVEEPEEDPVIEYDYSEFNSFGDYSLVLNESGRYMVYFYSLTCGACIGYEQTILTHINDFELRDEFYLICYDTATGNHQDIEFGEEGLRYMPTLMIIEDNVVVEYYEGTVEIDSYLESTLPTETE